MTVVCSSFSAYFGVNCSRLRLKDSVIASFLGNVSKFNFNTSKLAGSPVLVKLAKRVSRVP